MNIMEANYLNFTNCDINYNPKVNFEGYGKVFIDVENVKDFILCTEDKDYVIDFQKLLRDYGVEVEER